MRLLGLAVFMVAAVVLAGMAASGALVEWFAFGWSWAAGLPGLG